MKQPLRAIRCNATEDVVRALNIDPADGGAAAVAYLGVPVYADGRIPPGYIVLDRGDEHWPSIVKVPPAPP